MGNFINIDISKFLKYTRKYRYQIESSVECDYLYFEEPIIIEKFKKKWEAVNYLRCMYDTAERNKDKEVRNYHMKCDPYYIVVDDIKENSKSIRYCIILCGYFK